MPTPPRARSLGPGSPTSCNQVTGSLVAKDLGITLGACSFRIQGDLQTDATAEQFARLIDETARRCPVTQLFARSGLDLSSTWEQVALQDADVA